MKRITYPHKEELQSLLDYNPNTGEFIWKYRTHDLFKQKRECGDSCATWNTRFYGKTAGCQNRKYLIININGTLYQAHKLAYIYIHGDVSLNDDIDHINRDKLDNRICNLRSVSRSENLINNPRLANNTSCVCGVSFDKRLKKWHSYIKKNYKRIHLGVFKTKEDAVKARYEAEQKYGFTQVNPNSTAKQYLQEAAQ